VSRVRSNFIEMTLDHDTGAMTGMIVAAVSRGHRSIHLELSVLLGCLASSMRRAATIGSVS